MDLTVSGRGEARWGGRSARCALGPTGLALDKREGDGTTPIGRFELRRVLYRPDRLEPPATGLSVVALSPDDGWCDWPADPLYNRPVKLPYGARAERLWLASALYDVIVVLGHNDDPVRPGAGSAVFLHLAGEGYPPTQGCIGLALPDLLDYLAGAGPGDALVVEP